jgi:hypothetical protein
LVVELNPSDAVEALQVEEASPAHADAVQDQRGAQVDLKDN